MIRRHVMYIKMDSEMEKKHDKKRSAKKCHTRPAAAGRR